jgi:hypothetical protein
MSMSSITAISSTEWWECNNDAPKHDGQYVVMKIAMQSMYFFLEICNHDSHVTHHIILIRNLWLASILLIDIVILCKFMD